MFAGGKRCECTSSTGWSSRAGSGRRHGAMASVLGATTNEILFVAVLITMTLVGTYVGNLGEAMARLLQRRR